MGEGAIEDVPTARLGTDVVDDSDVVVGVRSVANATGFEVADRPQKGVGIGQEASVTGRAPRAFRQDLAGDHRGEGPRTVIFKRFDRRRQGPGRNRHVRPA